MKKYFIIMFAVMMTFGLSMSAQNRQGREGNRDRQRVQMTAKDRVNWMAKEIELTDIQKAEIESLFEKQDAKRAEDMAKMKEGRNQATTNRDKMREEMRSKREAEMKLNQAELEKIIGKEKAEKLNVARQKRIDANRKDRRN